MKYIKSRTFCPRKSEMEDGKCNVLQYTGTVRKTRNIVYKEALYIWGKPVRWTGKYASHNIKTDRLLNPSNTWSRNSLQSSTCRTFHTCTKRLSALPRYLTRATKLSSYNRVRCFACLAEISLTIASIKMNVIWDAAPCSLVETDRRFTGTYCLHYKSPWWWRQ
jgi:hypothetical protein